MSEFYILVDYDNLEKNACFTVSQFATAIMEIVKKLDQKSVFFNSSSKLQNINILLYGGWFFNDRLSYKAQEIRRQIQDNFPQLYRLKSNIQINVQCEMSYGILSLGKTKHFYATYRRYPARFEINKKYTTCCEDGDICVDFVKEWLKDKKCCYCSNEQEIFVSIGQKMVDSMLFCDLHFLSQEKENIIAVVSSDDDMIPMIFQENMLSDKIYHVLTLSEHGYFFSQFYDKIKPVNYKSVAW